MMKPYRIMRTCLPLLHGRLDELMSSQADLEAACPGLRAYVELLRGSDPIGRLGQYNGIYVVSPTFGGFTPIAGARPAQGEIGIPETGHTVEVKTYAGMEVSMDTIQGFIGRLVDLHPWEHPPIELATVELWMPDG